MIPCEVSNTNVYASLWSHLKSIDHALERVLGDVELSELDRDRLNALGSLLQGGLSRTDQSSQLSTSLREYSESTGPDFHSGIDLRRRLSQVVEFEEWQKAARRGFDVKVNRLIQAIEDFLNGPTNLFAKKVPQEELQVLHAIVRSMLAEAETALY